METIRPKNTKLYQNYGTIVTIVTVVTVVTVTCNRSFLFRPHNPKSMEHYRELKFYLLF